MFVQLEKTTTKSEKLSQMSKDRLLIYHRWKRLIIELSVHKYTHTQAAGTRSIEKRQQTSISLGRQPILFPPYSLSASDFLFDANQSVSHVSLTPFHINISRAWTNVILFLGICLGVALGRSTDVVRSVVSLRATPMDKQMMRQKTCCH